jgi:RimJ/RimL family protein N-acetyltransferase
MLETQRLLIIPLNLEQLKLLLAGTPRLEAALRLNPSGLELEPHTHEAMAYLANLAEQTPNYYPWISNWQIISKADNISVGSACFMNVPDAAGKVETGYGIYPAFQNCGYMTEALTKICEWAFEQADVAQIMAESEPDNLASQRVLKKCGFHKDSERLWSLVKYGNSHYDENADKL